MFFAKKEKRAGFDKPSTFFILSLSSLMSSTFRGKMLVVSSRIGTRVYENFIVKSHVAFNHLARSLIV